MKIITYNDESIPWSRRNHLMGTRLLPLSDDSNNFSRTSHKSRTEVMINQATLSLGLLNYANLSSLLEFFLCLNLKLVSVP
jgi:hypothetical protein